MFVPLIAFATLGLSYAKTLSVSVTDWPAINSAILEKSTTPNAFAAPPPPPEPVTPEGYELTYGPLSSANSAPGYMGFVFIDSYDTAACASLCNPRDFDAVGGLCQYFNIWEATVVGTEGSTFTCALYFLPTDGSTATNGGDATVSIKNARGYRRLSVVPDIEGFACIAPEVTCSTPTFEGWVGTSDSETVLDTANIVSDKSIAHFGTNSISLGSLSGTGDAAGTMTFANIPTVENRSYALEFFHSTRNPLDADAANVTVTWNGDVIETITGATSDWTFHGHTLVATGDDILSFHGGSFPAFDSIDDVYLFIL